MVTVTYNVPRSFRPFSVRTLPTVNMPHNPGWIPHYNESRSFITPSTDPDSTQTYRVRLQTSPSRCRVVGTGFCLRDTGSLELFMLRQKEREILSLHRKSL